MEKIKKMKIIGKIETKNKKLWKQMEKMKNNVNKWENGNNWQK